MKIKVFFKRSSIAYYTILSVISLSVILLISFFVYTAEKKSVINNLLTSEQNKLDLQIHEIINDFTFVERDVLLLRDLVTLVDEYSCLKGKTFDLLKDEFYHYIKQKGLYDQIRFIGQNGMEIIRVNYNSGKPEVIDDKFLQSKADRYYFQELKKLNDNDLYFSKFDLNIENDEIELPYKPVIRIGTRVTNCEEDFCGIVLVNYLGEDLIQRIKALNTNNLSRVHVLEPNGYFLISPEQENNWGFMFEGKKDKTYESIYPAAWNIIHNNEKGQFFTQDGLYTFKTLTFNQITENVNADNLDYYATDDYWKVISYVSDDKIKNLEREILARFYIPVSLLILLSIILSFILTYLKIREQHSKRLIIEKNDFLSKVINSISEPFYVLSSKNSDILMANKEANIYSIFEGSNFKENTLIKEQETEVMLKEFRKDIVASKMHKHLEIKIPRDNNTVKYLDINGYPILDKNSKVSQIIEVVNNVTDEKISEQKFKDLLASAPDGMIITNSKGEIEMVNSQAEKMFNYKASELIGKKIEVLIPSRFSNHHELRNGFIKNPSFKRMATGRELIGLKSNGKEFPVEISLSPIQTSEGLLISSAIRDITDRKEFERALKNREKQLKSFVKHTPNAVAMFDTNMKYLVVSDRWYKDYNLKEKNIIGKSHYDVFPEINDMEIWKDDHRRCLNGEILKVDEDKFVREDGSVNWLRYEIHPWYTDTNKIGGIIMYTEEITERKKIEEEVFDQAQILEQVVESVIATNMEGIIETWNHGAEELFGYKAEEMKGKHISLVYPEEERDNLETKVMKPLIEKGQHITEVIMQRKSGELFYGYKSLSLKKDKNNNVIGMIGSTIDITQSKKAQEELEKKQLMLSEAQRIAHLGSWEWDVKEDKISWSDELYNIFELNPKTFKADFETYIKFLPKEDANKLNGLIQNSLETKTGYHIEHKVVLRNGKEKYIEGVANVALDENGEVKLFYGTALDITDRKKAEEEIKKLNEGLEQKVKDRTKKLEEAYEEVAASKEEAEKANKAKSEFLANMSHEIRTPMNAVIGFSEILSKQVEDPVQKDFVESIKSSGKTLLGIINDILDLSKIEAGKLEIQAEPVNVRNLIKDIKALFDLRIKERNLEFIIDISDDIPNYLVIDELRVKQVLINLLSNAIKFTDEGFVKLKVKTFNANKNSTDLEITVEDSGIGITKEDQVKIFEAFHQKEGQITKKFGGTGLGLTISNKIINLMNSKIKVDSKINKGSKFYFTLKDIEIFTGEPESIKKFDFGPGEIDFKGSSILIIDDIEKNRKLLKSFLGNYNVKIQEAVDGSSGIEAFKKVNPDIILMDIRMPRMDGYQALKQIRALPGQKNIPIIAITASVHLDKKLIDDKDSFNGILHKPVELDELLSVLIQYLPYQKIKRVQEETGDSTNVLDLSVIESSNQLKSVLKNELESILQLLAKRKSNKATKELSNKLIFIGTEYNIEQFVKLGESLSLALKAFNISSIENLTEKFINYYNSIQE